MFEDLGLIHALYQIINNAYKERGYSKIILHLRIYICNVLIIYLSLVDEWHQLVQVLVRFTFDEYAEKLQIEISKFFQLVENSKSEIWNKSAPTSLTEIVSNC